MDNSVVQRELLQMIGGQHYMKSRYICTSESRLRDISDTQPPTAKTLGHFLCIFSVQRNIRSTMIVHHLSYRMYSVFLRNMDLSTCS